MKAVIYLRVSSERQKGSGLGRDAQEAATGRYSYSSKFARLCKCGRILAGHDAVAPHPFGDLWADGREELPECERFRLVRKPNAELLAAAIAAYQVNSPEFDPNEE